MRLFGLAALLAAVIALIGAAPSVEVPIPPAPTTWVTDNAGLLTSATRDSLDKQLADYDHSTGHQVIVWIGTTTGATPLEDWTIRAFTAWRVGRKGLDDGLALFIFTGDHKVRIEVGYGLEGVVTDALASRIEREIIVPHLKAGDGDGAVTEGVQALLAAIGGEPGAQPAPPAQNEISYADIAQLIFWLIGLIVFIVFAVRSPLLAGWTAYTIGSGRRYDGSGAWGGFSGGGFSGGGSGGFYGGGGAGGGGGASASW